MPNRATSAQFIQATDIIEFGGLELFITDVEYDTHGAGPVSLRMTPIGVEEQVMTAIVPRNWPVHIRRK